MRDRFLISLTLASVFISTSLAQSCLTLTQSSVCGDAFAGFPVSIKGISSEAQFNMLMLTRNVNSNAEMFADRFGCMSGVGSVNAMRYDLFTVRDCRYQLSFTCSSLIHNALTLQNCSMSVQDASAPKPHLICKEECAKATESLQGLFLNTTHCPLIDSTTLKNATLQIARNRKYDNLIQSCRVFEGIVGAGGCVRGVEAEAEYCGYSSMEVAKMQCRSMNDECCDVLFPAPFKLSVWIIVLISLGGISVLLCIAWIMRRQMRKSPVKPRFPKRTHTQRKTDRDSALQFPVSRPTTPQSQADLESGLRYPNLTPSLRSSHTHSLSFTTSTSPPTKKTQPQRVRFPQNPFMNPENKTGVVMSVMKVVYEYEKMAEDEIGLKVGEVVTVLRVFCDGWATGINSRLERGVFPLVCVENGSFRSSRSSFVSDEGSLGNVDVDGFSLGESEGRCESGDDVFDRLGDELTENIETNAHFYDSFDEYFKETFT